MNGKGFFSLAENQLIHFIQEVPSYFQVIYIYTHLI